MALAHASGSLEGHVINSCLQSGANQESFAWRRVCAHTEGCVSPQSAQLLYFMLQQSSILAFFGDAQGARAAFESVSRAGFRQSVLVSKVLDGGDAKKAAASFKVTRPTSVAPLAAGVGAALGFGLAQVVPVSRSAKPALGGALAALGGGVGWLAGSAWQNGLPEALVEENKTFLAAGESLVIVRAKSGADLRAAMELLRGEGEGGPVIFLERGDAHRFDTRKSPLRRDVLSSDGLRELAQNLGEKHKAAAPPSSLSANAFLLGRLKQNGRIIARVAQGLGEAARLGQPVSLSTEWLLDNNYIVPRANQGCRAQLDAEVLRRVARHRRRTV